MSTTFLSHLRHGCGGNVVIDASTSVKLYAPSFRISQDGIGDLMLDVNIASGGDLVPSYWCLKCGETISPDDLWEALSALCQVCGYSHQISDLNVHSQIATICNECLNSIKTVCNGGHSTNERIALYIDMYSLTKSIRVVPLLKVLKNTIKL